MATPTKRIKEKRLDDLFSLYIRSRDKTCQYPLRGPEDYHSNVLQCSHFYGRGARSVRWDEDNCDGICSRHHVFLEQRKNAEYYDWKFKQLGEQKFNALKKRYFTLKQWSEPEKRELLGKLLHL